MPARAFLRSIALAPLATVVAVSASAADAIELPARRSGYWEIRMQHAAPSVGDMTLHACIDTATDKAMMEAGTSAMQTMCSRQEMKRDGASYVWDTECTMGPMKTTSHVVLAGDFKSTYTMQITSDITGLPFDGGKDTPAKKTVTTQNAKWLAEACPAGVKPGDMQMPGGLTVNVNDMIKSLGVAKTPWRP